MPRTTRTTRRKRRRSPAPPGRRFAPRAVPATSTPITPCPAATMATLRQVMFDEMERLRDVSGLCALLERYELLAKPDRQVWQDRVADLDGVGLRDLVRLHGELMAYGWVEQNTGTVTPGTRGTTAACYRITPSGLRALKQRRSEALTASV